MFQENFCSLPTENSTVTRSTGLQKSVRQKTSSGVHQQLCNLPLFCMQAQPHPRFHRGTLKQGVKMENSVKMGKCAMACFGQFMAMLQPVVPGVSSGRTSVKDDWKTELPSTSSIPENTQTTWRTVQKDCREIQAPTTALKLSVQQFMQCPSVI